MSQPPPPKVRSRPPPKSEAARADDVLDAMFINVRLPKPTEPPKVEEHRDERERPQRPPG